MTKKIIAWLLKYFNKPQKTTQKIEEIIDLGKWDKLKNCQIHI